MRFNDNNKFSYQHHSNIRGIGEMNICVENHHSPYTQHSIVNIQQSYGYVLTYVALTIIVCVSLYVFELSALSVYINEIGSDKAKVSTTAQENPRKETNKIATIKTKSEKHE